MSLYEVGWQEEDLLALPQEHFLAISTVFTYRVPSSQIIPTFFFFVFFCSAAGGAVTASLANCLPHRFAGSATIFSQKLFCFLLTAAGSSFTISASKASFAFTLVMPSFPWNTTPCASFPASVFLTASSPTSTPPSSSSSISTTANTLLLFNSYSCFSLGWWILSFSSCFFSSGCQVVLC